MKKKSQPKTLRFIIPIFISLVIVLGIGISLKIISKAPSLETKTAFAHEENSYFGKQVAEGNGEWVEEVGIPIFDNQPITQPPQKDQENRSVGSKPNSSNVLGLNFSNDGKWIEVDLTKQKLYAWDKGLKVFDFDISSGRKGRDTPTGEFTVWRKVKYQAYRGGSKERGDYYYLPNVPHSLFFYNEEVDQSKGYAIHGAYWHNDFGKKRKSNGCVNLRLPDAEKLYYWAGPIIPDGVGAVNSTPENPGIRVLIHD